MSNVLHQLEHLLRYPVGRSVCGRLESVVFLKEVQQRRQALRMNALDHLQFAVCFMLEIRMQAPPLLSCLLPAARLARYYKPYNHPEL